MILHFRKLSITPSPRQCGKKIEANKHVYFCSKGLKRATVEYRGELRRDIQPDYINEYVGIKTVRTLDEAMRYFTDENE